MTNLRIKIKQLFCRHEQWQVIPMAMLNHVPYSDYLRGSYYCQCYHCGKLVVRKQSELAELLYKRG